MYNPDVDVSTYLALTRLQGCHHWQEFQVQLNRRPTGHDYRHLEAGQASSYCYIYDGLTNDYALSPNSSGSQTMAYVLGLQQGWDTTKMEFRSKTPTFATAQQY